MSIRVTCPNGHKLKIKNKYAGKRGRCPHCAAHVDVPEMHKLISEEVILAIIGPDEVREGATEEEQETAAMIGQPIDSDGEDFNDLVHQLDEHNKTSGISLLNSSLIRRGGKNCPNCDRPVPHWFASCPDCHTMFAD